MIIKLKKKPKNNLSPKGADQTGKSYICSDGSLACNAYRDSVHLFHRKGAVLSTFPSAFQKHNHYRCVWSDQPGSRSSDLPLQNKT